MAITKAVCVEPELFDVIKNNRVLCSLFKEGTEVFQFSSAFDGELG